MAATIKHSDREAQVPKLHESYTTYLYWGFALVFAVLLVLGFTMFP